MNSIIWDILYACALCILHRSISRKQRNEAVRNGPDHYYLIYILIFECREPHSLLYRHINVKIHHEYTFMPVSCILIPCTVSFVRVLNIFVYDVYVVWIFHTQNCLPGGTVFGSLWEKVLALASIILSEAEKVSNLVSFNCLHTEASSYTSGRTGKKCQSWQICSQIVWARGFHPNHGVLH